VLKYIEGGLEACAESQRGNRRVTGESSRSGSRRLGSSWNRTGQTMHMVSQAILEIPADCFRIQFLFLEPNASDPLNKEAAEDLRSNREGFKRNVKTSMAGGSVKGQGYERVTK